MIESDERRDVKKSIQPSAEQVLTFWLMADG
jgi:hypothetical protein